MDPFERSRIPNPSKRRPIKCGFGDDGEQSEQYYSRLEKEPLGELGRIYHRNSDGLELQYADYHGRIKRTIAQKRTKLLKKSIIEGRLQATRDSLAFIHHLQNANKKLDDAKIQNIIKYTEIILKEYIHNHPVAIVAMTLKLLGNIAEVTDVELSAHKKDVETIKNSLNEIAMACTSARKITTTEDDSFSRGSLVIKANKSIIDAHLKTQLNTAKNFILATISCDHKHLTVSKLRGAGNNGSINKTT